MHITKELSRRAGLAPLNLLNPTPSAFEAPHIRAQPDRLQRVLGGMLGKVKSSLVLDVYPTAHNQMLTMKISLNRIKIGQSNDQMHGKPP